MIAFAQRWRALGTLCAAALGGWAQALSIDHEVPQGTLSLHLPDEADGWQCTVSQNVGDLLFPDGVTLASMRHTGEGGLMVTISLDEKHPTPPAEQAAFLALARDREKAGRMAVWELPGHTWIVQAFRSPSERVLAVQTFLGPYALAYLFWFDGDGDAARQAGEAKAILEQWQPSWRPTPTP